MHRSWRKFDELQHEWHRKAEELANKIKLLGRITPPYREPGSASPLCRSNRGVDGSICCGVNLGKRLCGRGIDGLEGRVGAAGLKLAIVVGEAWRIWERHDEGAFGESSL